MSVAKFVAELRSLDVVLRREGNRLVCDAPTDVLTPALRERLRRDKEKILQFLRETETTAPRRDRSAGAIPALRRREDERSRVPQSFAQQRLW